MPHITPGHRLEDRQKFNLPAPLLSSIPPKADNNLVTAAIFESGPRTNSEWILCNVLYSLPYGNTLARDQLKAASDYGLSTAVPLPFQSLCRSLPKGAIGIQQTQALPNDGKKALPDDRNYALIPAICMLLLGDDAVVLPFVGQCYNLYFRTTTSPWFMGWTRHKTEVLEDPTICSKGYVGRRANPPFCIFNT
jgi:hypothetical protein